MTLSVQSAISKSTLVFGSIRWVDWSEFQVAPPGYMHATGGDLLSYSEDTVAYEIGLGQKLNNTWSIAGTLGYEPPMDILTTTTRNNAKI